MTESGLKLICWVFALGLAGATLAVPQAVAPWEMPSLVLDRTAVSDAIRFDQALAAEAVDTEEARTLRALFLDHGRAETKPPYPVNEYDRRQLEIHSATEALISKHGRSAFESMRALAVEELVSVFDGADDAEGRTEEDVAIIGGFAEVARTYGLVHRGVVVAPELTIRALYKARWNAIHRQPFTDGFSDIELQAYWGWLALHGWGQPLERRRDALVAFRTAGGQGTQEAAALFDLLSGRPDRAATSLQALYVARGELRLRNLGLGALHASLLRSAPP